MTIVRDSLRSPKRSKNLSALFVPLIILGGIYGGIFTPTEAAVVAVIYSVSSGNLYTMS